MGMGLGGGFQASEEEDPGVGMVEERCPGTDEASHAIDQLAQTRKDLGCTHTQTNTNTHTRAQLADGVGKILNGRQPGDLT